MLMSELHIANGYFPEARRALGDLYETDPTTRSATLMAAIERGEGADDHVVKGWLTRALSLPRGPQWICDSCHHIHAEWVPTCGNCESFDTLSWKAPPKSEGSLPSGIQMLPLIVGAAGKGDTDIVVVDEVKTVDP
jgi:HemY protein